MPKGKKFDAWHAGMPGPDQPDPVAAGALAEKNELRRIAAQAVIDRDAAGETVDAMTLVWARQFVAAVKPLGRALGTGEPV